MELLLSNNPMIKKTLPYHSVSDYFGRLMEQSDTLNIATGFVSNASLVELNDWVSHRQEQGKLLTMNLLIGMDYIEQFTRLQYEALKELNAHLTTDGIGSIMVSRELLYHGKMYSFLKEGKCTDAFVGSSNLGSFVGTSDNLVESDVLFRDNEAEAVNQRILKLFETIGTDFSTLPEQDDFKKPVFTLLDDNIHVKRIKKEKYDEIISQSVVTDTVEIPLKTEKKSNLNAYFGKGKSKGRWSPRDWYEVEVIVSEKKAFRDYLSSSHFPEKGEAFKVLTDDQYMFECKLEGGTVGKNLRTVGDLRILGKWIKGHMEAEGVLKLRKLITPQLLDSFGKSKLVFTRTATDVWMLKMA